MPSYLIPYLGSNNSVYSIIKKEILDQVLFQRLIAEATIVDYTIKTETKTYLWSLERDSLVSVLNTLHITEPGHGNRNLNFTYFDNENYKVCTGGVPFNVDHVRA